MNKTIIFGICLIGIILVSGCTNQFYGQEINFETIYKNSYSGYDDRGDYIIRDDLGWETTWATVNSITTPTQDLPIVDFNIEMVIAVFQGNQYSGGYDIEIIKIIEKDDSIEVFVKETSPKEGTMQTQALTQPCHIVKIQKNDKEVIFKR